jgi:TRAP-type C4-dicarboxylate transport system substrate-binding protein
MADLRGMKLAALSRPIAQIVDTLGGTPVTMVPPEMYPSMQRGLVHGLVIGWSGMHAFKLGEVTTNHLEMPSGQAASFMFMNKDAYAKLPDKARAAIDRYGYESFALRLGQVTDKMDEVFTAMLTKLPDHKVYRFSPADEAQVKRRLAPITDEWLKATPNGPAVLAAYRAEIAKLRTK